CDTVCRDRPAGALVAERAARNEPRAAADGRKPRLGQCLAGSAGHGGAVAQAGGGPGPAVGACARRPGHPAHRPLAGQSGQRAGRRRRQSAADQREPQAAVRRAQARSVGDPVLEAGAAAAEMTMGRLRAAAARPTGLGALALPLLLPWLLAVAACGAVADPPQRHTFLIQLDAAPTLARAQRKPAESVYVAPVLVAAPFSGRNLVIRQSELGFETDPYAEFAASPVSMWTDAVRSWLDSRRLFERVLPVGSSADASLTLETNLL